MAESLSYWEKQREVVYSQWLQSQKDFASSKVGKGKLKFKKIMNELEQELKRIDGNIEEAAKALAFQTLASQGQNGYAQSTTATLTGVTGIISATGTATKDILLGSKGLGGTTSNTETRIPQSPLTLSGLPDMGDMMSGKNKIYMVAAAAVLLLLMFRK